MKIKRIDDLHANAGWRNFSFLRIETTDGIVGWSEYTEADGSRGLTGIIKGLSDLVIGQHPHRIQYITSHLASRTVQAPGGVNQRAIAAIENALLDIKGKSLGVPVYDLLGGKVRDRLPVYFSHCGTYRVRNHEAVGVPQLRTYDQVAKLGEWVKSQGFKALKTNILRLDCAEPSVYGAGFGRTEGHPELNSPRDVLIATQRTLAAFREGAGPDMGLHLDTNYNFKTAGYLKIAQAVEPYDLTWLELDTWDPQGLAVIRNKAPCPIASLESVTHRRGFRPFLDAYSVDVAIVDIIWNGLFESVKIAAMADAYEVNCAPHNYYGHLSSVIGAHFCATIPNFAVMEIDIDSAPWRDELVTAVPTLENGDFIVPTAPGWGIDIDERGVAKHPPR